MTDKNEFGADPSEPVWVVYAKVRDPGEDALTSSAKIQLPTLDEAVRFWHKLPENDRNGAAIETASGRHFDAAAIPKLVRRQRDE